MTNQQKGFMGIVVIFLIALAATGGGVYMYRKQKINSTYATSTIQNDLNDFKDSVNAEAGKEVIIETTVKTDSAGKPRPAVIVNQETLNDLVVEKYGKDSAYVHRLINSSLMAIGSGWQNEAVSIRNKNDYSYAKACDGVKVYFNAEADKNITHPEFADLNAKLGITADSYRINELVCKSNDDGYVVTVPVTLEDGTNSKFCVSSSGSGYGDADFATMTCIKK